MFYKGYRLIKIKIVVSIQSYIQHGRSKKQQISKLSDIIHAKYKKIRYNKTSSKDKINKVFKPVVEPLKKLVEISNDKTKQENEQIKQKNNGLKNWLIFENY